MKTETIKNLDKIINKVIEQSEKDLLLVDDRNCYYIGPYKIVYENRLYSIWKDGKVLYEDISLIDSVISIIKYMMNNRYWLIKDVLSYDEGYYHMIMNIKYYNNHIKNKGNNGIYEDRILEDRHKAAYYKNRIIQSSQMMI